MDFDKDEMKALSMLWGAKTVSVADCHANIARRAATTAGVLLLLPLIHAISSTSLSPLSFVFLIS
jgi:hypothetical protein